MFTAVQHKTYGSQVLYSLDSRKNEKYRAKTKNRDIKTIPPTPAPPSDSETLLQPTYRNQDQQVKWILPHKLQHIFTTSIS